MPSRITGSLGAGSATRDVSNLRNHKKVTDMMADGVGYLTDQTGKHRVKLEWDVNEMAKRDGIFRMTIGDKSAYIDLEELMYHTRIMFARK